MRNIYAVCLTLTLTLSLSACSEKEQVFNTIENPTHTKPETTTDSTVGITVTTNAVDQTITENSTFAFDLMVTAEEDVVLEGMTLRVMASPFISNLKVAVQDNFTLLSPTTTADSANFVRPVFYNSIILRKGESKRILIFVLADANFPADTFVISDLLSIDGYMVKDNKRLPDFPLDLFSETQQS